MRSAVLLVVGTLTAFAAWSQSPSTETPPDADFDLNSAPIQKILRDTAASQFPSPQLSEHRDLESEPVRIVKYVPPETRPRKAIGKISIPTPARPVEAEATFFSAMIDTLVDTLFEKAFGLDHGDPVETSAIGWLSCQARIDLKQETPGLGSCNE